ncbi:hypothetical protein [Ulvibacter litoralis]|uniref:LSU ribosomal protein L21p n=1 Tax=Ulvibacter litoralis TaxID=227084 RepID=A0A1G7DFS6_9FLAO|nr:hypothetical protein [Ulvibacter litoralis]GHC43593.1 hypothetical protein GCM10008083_02500 [Ulvibacter litoralis]SDE50454.1 hypothetical protein SAMN05421855_101960 [Ulvibacter litoralis]
MNWCILIPLLVGLISAYLGYLIGKLNSKNDAKPSGDIELWRKKNIQLESELAACKSKLSAGAGNVSSSSTASFAAAATAAPVVFNASAAKAIFGKTIKQDDLTVVEGIGPKIRDLFHSNNIKTWKALSETSVDRCKEILKSGGERFSVHNPGTWPRQAKMAYEGTWQVLLDWQNVLDKGKE